MSESDGNPKRDAIRRRITEIAEFLRRREPKWHECPLCMGRGSADFGHTTHCLNCDGQGGFQC